MTIASGETTDSSKVVLYYLSSIGGIIGVFVLFVLLFHILYNSLKLLKKKINKNKKTDKIIYYLVFGYLSTGIIICFNYAFVRSNLITSISVTQWTESQCAAGYFISYTFLAINKSFLYALFFYRIYIVFKNTSYEYPKLFLQILYAIFLSLIIITQCIAYIGVSSIPWYLYVQGKYLYCGADSTSGFPTTSIIAILIAAASEFIWTAILLYLFIKKVYNLQKTLLEQFVGETTDNESIVEKSKTSIVTGGKRSEMVTLTTTKSENNAINDSLSTHDSNQISMHVKRKSNTFTALKNAINSASSVDIPKGNPLSRIIRLHKLIKKQTIIVCIALISSLLVWVLSATWNSSMSVMFSWDIIINAVCIWLMFGVNEKYWNFLISYCCCKLCYINNDDDK